MRIDFSSSTTFKIIMKYRQAVVLIHGIGEQIPMDLLRGFVDGVIPDFKDGKKTINIFNYKI